MRNKWNRKNALWMLLYAVLYAVVTAVVCVTGSIHPVFFVCYQITAGLLLPPIIMRAFRRVQAQGAAVCLFLGMLLLLLIINDAVLWHVVPLIVITVLAETVRGMTNYSWSRLTVKNGQGMEKQLCLFIFADPPAGRESCSSEP